MAKTIKSPDETEQRQASAKQLSRFVPSDNIDDQFGRPTVISLEVLLDLKYAFLIGSTNREAALYAGISESTYYRFLEQMDMEMKQDFSELVEGWKNDMILAARMTMRKATATPEHAKWLLERRRKDEFAPRTQHEVKEVSDFDSLTDEELEKIANAGHTDNQSTNRNSETQE